MHLKILTLHLKNLAAKSDSDISLSKKELYHFYEIKGYSSYEDKKARWVRSLSAPDMTYEYILLMAFLFKKTHWQIGGLNVVRIILGLYRAEMDAL